MRGMASDANVVKLYEERKRYIQAVSLEQPDPGYPMRQDLANTGH